MDVAVVAREIDVGFARGHVAIAELSLHSQPLDCFIGYLLVQVLAEGPAYRAQHLAEFENRSGRMDADDGRGCLTSDVPK